MDKINILENFDIQREINELAHKLPELNKREDLIKELYKYINPRIYWLDMDIDFIHRDGLKISTKQGSELHIESEYIAGEFYNCKKASLLATTLGGEISEYSKRCYDRGSYSKSIIADTVGSHGVEALIEKFHRYLSQINLSKGLYSINRYSPGYGDWSLSQQGEILELLKTESNIRANPHNLLEPVKSITAIIGWSKTPRTHGYTRKEENRDFCREKNNCQYCNTQACKK